VRSSAFGEMQVVRLLWSQAIVSERVRGTTQECSDSRQPFFLCLLYIRAWLDCIVGLCADQPTKRS